MPIEDKLLKILDEEFEKYNKELGSSINKEILKNFDAQKDIDGNNFSPLRDSTVKQKRRAGFGDKPILVRTGKLRKSIKTSIRKKSIKVSSNVSYAQVLNDGRTDMAARPFLKIPEKFEPGTKDSREIFEKFAKTLEKKITNVINKAIIKEAK